MKTKIIYGIFGLLGIAAFASQPNDDAVRPKAQITFIVKDDFGKPIPNIEFGMSTFHHMEPGEAFGKSIYVRFASTTGNDGKVVLNGQGINNEFYCGMKPNNEYYDRASLRYRFQDIKDGRWEPWNPTIEIIYKPILKPIAMYHGQGQWKLPERQNEIGFDLGKGDFVSPYGTGNQIDLILKLEEEIPYESVHKPYAYRLKITFPNKGDGIQSWYGPVNVQKDSMEMPRYAPDDGYESNLELKFEYPEKVHSKQREDQNYFFRVRTRLDKNGEVKSALYGKIAGNVRCDVINSKTGILFFDYYLNPTPLDVNMEHDPKKNLIPQKGK